MAVDIVIPEVGEVGMEVTFVVWYRQDGESVAEGEPLFQVDTQKTLFDVESVASGTLAGISVGPGDLVEPRQVIARILAPGETLEAATAATVEAGPPARDAVDPSPVTAPTSSQAPAERPVRSRIGRPAASPRAKALATELGLDLEAVEGSGPDGLITEADIRRAADRPAAPATSVPSSLDRSSRVRRAVAELTTRSWAEVPHFYIRLEADLTTGLDRAKPLPLVVGALARALQDRPECHVGWGPDGAIIARSSVDIGILVDTPDGLLLPVVQGVERLDIGQLAEAIRTAAERARSGRLSADDFRPRSATVSNLGMFSVDEFAGIVATPDPLLLSIGRATTRPRWDGAAWQPRTVATLTFSVDHRVLDGADAGRLATALEGRLASPDWVG